MGDKKPFIFGIVGFLLGAGLVWFGATTQQLEPPVTSVPMTHDMSAMQSMDNDMAMEAMTAQLEGKTGSEFDQAFLDQMLVHHLGAIEMAQLAQQNAQQQEIKDLAAQIIEAQTAEVNQMQQWQHDWFGYYEANGGP